MYIPFGPGEAFGLSNSKRAFRTSARYDARNKGWAVIMQCAYGGVMVATGEMWR